MPEARLVDTGAGLAPQGDGWFVVNAADVTWMRNDHFGARASFEVDGRLATERPEPSKERFHDKERATEPGDRCRITSSHGGAHAGP